MPDDRLFNEDPLDPEAAKIADRYIQLVKEEKQTKERREIQARNLLGLLRKTNRQQVRHGEYLIKISHKPESEKLQLIEPKTGRKKSRKAK
jgi:hypothetical protein